MRNTNPLRFLWSCFCLLSLRFYWSCFFLIIGLSMLIKFWIRFSGIFDLIKSNSTGLFWCIGWAATGIALGLFNSRKSSGENSKRSLHYITYFGFVLFIATLAAFNILLLHSGLTSYSGSCLVAIVIGFAGDSLAGALERLAPLPKG